MSLVWFKVKPGMNEEFELAFIDAGMLERPKLVPGFRFVHLHRSLMNDDEYFVLGEWDTEESYAEWQRRAQDGAPLDALRRLGATLVEHRPNTLMRRVDPR